MTTTLLYSNILSVIMGTELVLGLVFAVYLAAGLGIGIFLLVQFFNLCHDVWLLKRALIK